MNERQAIPVRELERAEVRELVREAAVIMAIDPARTSPGTDGMLIYGRALLEDIRNGQAAEWGPQRVLFFSLDSESDELEYLCDGADSQGAARLRGRDRSLARS